MGLSQIVDNYYQLLLSISGGKVGFPCFHLYERDEDLPKREIPATATSNDFKLRGADALISIVAARSGAVVKVMR